MDNFTKRDNKRLDKIIGAGSSQNMVYIKYKDRKGKVSQRYLEPYEIRGEDFFAYDPDKDSIRRFKIKRIQSLKSTKKKYEPRWEIKMPGMTKKANEFEYSPDEERLIGEIMLADSKGRLNELKGQKRDASLFDFKTKSALRKDIKKSKGEIRYNKSYLDSLGKTASEIINSLLKGEMSGKMTERRDKDNVVFDFDGVIHSYKSGWQGVTTIPDEPVEGIKEAIDDLRKDYKVLVMSARCFEPGGVEAIKKWLSDNEIVVDDVVDKKPPAVAYIDDNGINFSGDAKSLPEQVRSHKSWTNKAASEHLEEMYKIATINEDLQLKNGKIPAIEKALHTPIEKEVATMLATSHEYKVPAVDAALAIVKNYKWEKTTAKVGDLQGIDKPVKKDKVLDIAVGVKKRGGVVNPFIVVDKLNGIKPQSPGKKILLDGHHRLEACKFLDKKEVPVYRGTFTGGAQKDKSVLREGK